MVTKVYGIWGRSRAIVQVKTGSGRAYVEADFDRGIPTEGPNFRPATFSTSDPVVQQIMERSPLFNNLYVLYKVMKHEDPASTESLSKEPKKTDVEPLDGISTKDEVVAYLKSRGAKATNLKDPESILKFAEKIGVSFPNVTL